MTKIDPVTHAITYYGGVLSRRRYLVLLVVLAVVSLFTWGSLLWPKTYEASTTVFIERSALINPLIKDIRVTGNMEERLRTLKESLLSRHIIARVLKKTVPAETIGDERKYEGMIASLQKRIEVKISNRQYGEREPDLFTISFRGNNPGVVKGVVDTLLHEYIEDTIKHRQADASGAYEFMNRQLREYKVKLEEADRAIGALRSANPKLVSPTGTALLGSAESFHVAKIQADIQIKELTRKRQILQKQLSGERKGAGEIVTSDGSPQARLEQLNKKLVSLLTVFTENHPDVTSTKYEIEELRKQIAQAQEQYRENPNAESVSISPAYQQMKEELVKIDSEIEMLRARSSELERNRQLAQGTLGRMSWELEQWEKLQRDRDSYQRIYDDMLRKLESAKASKDVELTDTAAKFRVVDPAVLPLDPIRPNRVLLITLGILLGLGSGVGAAVILENRDPSYRNEESVEAELKLPVLATVPLIITEAEKTAAKKRDRRVFAAAGVYSIVIILVWMQEMLYKFTGVRLIDF